MPGATHEILIVENDQLTAELYRRELSREYEVFTCTDERAALDLLSARSISVVVLEPALGGGQGWQLLSTIRDAYNRHIPIILCSTLDERGRGMGLGAAAYLVKPALPTTLRETVRRVMLQD